MTHAQFLSQGEPNQPIAESVIRPLGAGRWLVEQGFTSHILSIDDAIVTVEVPAGYISDLASIPRFAWSFIGHPLTGEFQDAALVHDVLCDRAAEKCDYELRVIADGVFFYLLKRRHVPYWRRKAMLWAVRLHAWWTLAFARAQQT